MNYKYKFKESVKVRIQDLNLGDIPNVETKSQWKKMIKKNLVNCDDKPATLSTWVYPNSKIEILWDRYLPRSTKVFPLILEVLFEDDYLAVVYKPPGLPTSGNVFKSLQNALTFNLKQSDKMTIGDSFQTCHRLDFSTSGLVVVSKTKACRLAIGKLFEQQKVDKSYYAVLQGQLELNEGFWNDKIDGKPSKSHYEVLKFVPSLKNEYLSLVKLSPKTGRTHQLRIHSSVNGYPIVGDTKYGEVDNMKKGKGLFLSAFKIEFQHPFSDLKIIVESPLPNKFQKFLENEEKRFSKYH